MKNNQYIRQAQYKKGFANMVLIGVIIVLLSIGGYFVFTKKAIIPITKEPVINSETTTPIPQAIKPVTVFNSIGQLQESFQKAIPPQKNDLIGTWVLTTYISTQKFQIGTDGPDYVWSNINGIKRSSDQQNLASGVQSPETKGTLEWKMEFNNDSNGNLKVQSQSAVASFNDVSSLNFNPNGDLTFQRDYGGDYTWEYQCRMIDSSHLVCLLKNNEDKHGVMFSKISNIN